MGNGFFEVLMKVEVILGFIPDDTQSFRFTTNKKYSKIKQMFAEKYHNDNLKNKQKNPIKPITNLPL